MKNRQAQIDDTLHVNPFRNRSRLILNDLTGPLSGKVFEDLPFPVDVGHSLKHLREHASTLLSRRSLSNDRLLNIRREENEILYYLYTSDVHHLDRYEDLSFGLVQNYIPSSYRTDPSNGFLHKLGVKNTARIFTDLDQSDVESDSSSESSSRERSPVGRWNHRDQSSNEWNEQYVIDHWIHSSRFGCDHLDLHYRGDVFIRWSIGRRISFGIYSIIFFRRYASPTLPTI